MIPKKRLPTHPGEVLRAEFLEPKEITQARLAREMGVSVQTVNLLVKGKRAVTAETALALARIFKTTPQFWMNLQTNYDLARAQRQLDEGAAADSHG